MCQWVSPGPQGHSLGGLLSLYLGSVVLSPQSCAPGLVGRSCCTGPGMRADRPLGPPAPPSRGSDSGGLTFSGLQTPWLPPGPSVRWRGPGVGGPRRSVAARASSGSPEAPGLCHPWVPPPGDRGGHGPEAGCPGRRPRLLVVRSVPPAQPSSRHRSVPSAPVAGAPGVQPGSPGGRARSPSGLPAAGRGRPVAPSGGKQRPPCGRAAWWPAVGWRLRRQRPLPRGLPAPSGEEQPFPHTRWLGSPRESVFLLQVALACLQGLRAEEMLKFQACLSLNEPP